MKRWRHHHHGRRGGALRRYVGARLHRRIFVWFGVSIALTIGIVLGVLALVSAQSPWDAERARIERFVSSQFSHVWDAPDARDRLAADLARDGDVSVALYDQRGALIGQVGGSCARQVLRAHVRRDGAIVGEVRACRGHRGFGKITGFLIFVVAGVCLWLAAGVIARRLTRPLGHVARVAQDIGDGKLDSRVKLKRRHCGDELGLLGGAINDMAGRIQKQLDDQRALLAAVSHELRTPLGHMRLLVELLRDGRADENRLDELEREIVDIDALVGQLLASSRLVFDTIDRRSLDAVDVATRALERAGLAGDVLTVEAEAIDVAGDATLLLRALANLLDNARSHGGGVTELRVTQAGDGSVRFEVVDDGPGFADGEASKVFEKFYRGENRAGQSSLGLGLALVQRIAQAHGGDAWAANRDAGGARVGFSVAPLVDADVTGDARSAAQNQ